MKQIFKLTIGGILLLVSCNNTESINDNTATDNGEEKIIEKDMVPKKIDINLTALSMEDVPKECEYDYNLVDAYTWWDENGQNYFLRTISEIDFSEESGESLDMAWSSYSSQYLFAYHYIDNGQGIELSRKVQDLVEMCEFDVMVSHEEESVELTDIDGDQIGEISFVYRLTCTSDVSPSTQKLLMLENGDKYILRGQTQVMGYGGDYEVDASFDQAPDGFLKHCKELWKKHLTQYDEFEQV